MEFYFFLVCEGLMLSPYTVIGRVKNRQERKKAHFRRLVHRQLSKYEDFILCSHILSLFHLPVILQEENQDKINGPIPGSHQEWRVIDAWIWILSTGSCGRKSSQTSLSTGELERFFKDRAFAMRVVSENSNSSGC